MSAINLALGYFGKSDTIEMKDFDKETWYRKIGPALVLLHENKYVDVLGSISEDYPVVGILTQSGMALRARL